MERDGGGFGAGVVDELRGGNEAGHAGDCDDHAVVGAYHGGEEGACEAEVGEDVEGEDALEGGVGGGEDGEAVGEAGVVDEDGGGAVGGEDVLGGGGDGGRGGEVAVVVVDVGGCCGERGGLDRCFGRRESTGHVIAYGGRRLEVGCRGL